MKPLTLLALVLGITLFVGGAIAIVALQSNEPTPTQDFDIPRYTADQVIAVARAYAGDECGITRWQHERFPEASWATVYGGNGQWKVTKNCGSFPGSKSWIFYEATGQLVLKR